MRASTSPVLADPAFVARPIEIADAAAWLEYAALPQVRKHTSSTIRTLEDLLLIGRCNSDEPGSPMHFAVCSRDGGRLVATVGFHTVSTLHRTAEITYDVHPEHQGKGLASMCCAAATAWGFEHCGFVRIQGTTLESNVASQAVLRKCGFVREGTLRSFRIVRGRPRDFLVFSVVRESGGDEG
jgi:RimJ/RimL family protein N-acetyltransferase